MSDNIKEAVILLGGMGKRLLPYTKTISKEMLPILDVPAIFLLVKEAYLSGIRKIIFVVTNHNKNLIQSFFEEDTYLNEFLKDKEDKKQMLDEVNKIISEMEFVYVLQKEKGTYGALYSAKDVIQNDNFIVMYGDDLILADYPITKKMLDEQKKKSDMYILGYEKDYQHLPSKGIIEMDNDNYLTDLKEKEKANTHLEFLGRMLLNKKVFTIKDKLVKHDNDEYYLPYALLHFPWGIP